jgi:quinone-modifying oxidoreductase subunit QmoB
LIAKTCIFGSGCCARQVAALLLEAGRDVILVTGKKTIDISPSAPTDLLPQTGPEILSEALILSIDGAYGDFKLQFLVNGTTVVKEVSDIVIAEETVLRTHHELYGLNLGKHVWPLAHLKDHLSDAKRNEFLTEAPKHVVFLNSLAHEGHPVAAKEAMDAAYALQSDNDIQTYMLTGNLKVASNGLEALYRRTKEAGTFYIKFTNTRPDMIQSADSRVEIEFVDEVTGLKFQLQPDLVVVDEIRQVSEITKQLAHFFELETDPKGFIQADNVHRLPCFTNRKGVFAVGPAQGVQTAR